MYRVGADDHGVWLWAPPGSSIARGDETPIVIDESFLQLIPTTAHWTAIFNGPDARAYDVYVDVCTPPRWPSQECVEMIDLDLDVVRLPDGSVEVLDEDEFAAHAVSLGYPASMITRARATAAELAIALKTGTEPFGSDWHRWWTIANSP